MLVDLLAAIEPLDEAAMDLCQLRLDNLTKPLGSLNGLEYLARKVAGVTRKDKPRNIKRSIILMAADHGVAEEGVGAFSSEVTWRRVVNCCHGQAVINSFANYIDVQLVLVDVGIASDLPDLPTLRREKVRYGSANIIKGPAMTREETLRAIERGICVARDELAKGIQIIGLGEFGTANTTSAAAVVACYAALPIVKLAGKDNDMSSASFKHKVQVIEQALAVNQPDIGDPLAVLAKLGGLEIAGLVGVILAAAAGRAVVVIDGVVTAAAALIAVKLAPEVKDYLVGSHLSCEPAHSVALELIGIPAYLHLNLQLGEGTGAALGISMIDASLGMLNDMKTFGEAKVAIAQDGPGAVRQRLDV
ncbi:MAG: Nicotinate-nucleotide--dimethylbenzimidazole phosphoribosyltransferase [Firmicutes bacterium]|nr:Nicotinate-nucleotide--dimethylbenzimidazole phosphoribosyltransferase [Bacillota bacterium]